MTGFYDPMYRIAALPGLIAGEEAAARGRRACGDETGAAEHDERARRLGYELAGRHLEITHDFLRYNPSRAEVEANREAERVRKASYRESKRRPNGTDTGTPYETPGGRDPESEHPVPSRPDPVPKTDINHLPESGHHPNVREPGPTISDVVAARAKRIGIKDLDGLIANLATAIKEPVAPEAAVELAEVICGRSKNPVDSVDAYVASACLRSPDDVSWHFERLDLGVFAS